MLHLHRHRLQLVSVFFHCNFIAFYSYFEHQFCFFFVSTILLSTLHFLPPFLCVLFFLGQSYFHHGHMSGFSNIIYSILHHK